jgi:hypothetical protein
VWINWRLDEQMGVWLNWRLLEWICVDKLEAG